MGKQKKYRPEAEKVKRKEKGIKKHEKIGEERQLPRQNSSQKDKRDYDCLGE